jgi:hypothetical protein
MVASTLYRSEKRTRVGGAWFWFRDVSMYLCRSYLLRRARRLAGDYWRSPESRGGEAGDGRWGGLFWSIVLYLRVLAPRWLYYS